MTDAPKPGPRAFGPDMMGRYWVQVSPAMARGHAKGRPGVLLYAIALWFVIRGALQIVALGASMWVVFALLRVVAGLGLALGAPFARALAILLMLIGFFGVPPVDLPLMVDDVGVPLGVLFGIAVLELGMMWHLFDGERPNLVYGHRYRSYRAEAQTAEAPETDKTP